MLRRHAVNLGEIPNRGFTCAGIPVGYFLVQPQLLIGDDGLAVLLTLHFLRLHRLLPLRIGALSGLVQLFVALLYLDM